MNLKKTSISFIFTNTLKKVLTYYLQCAIEVHIVNKMETLQKVTFK